MLQRKINMISSLAASLLLMICFEAQAQTETPEILVVTLCLPGEQTLMAGRMQQVKNDAKGITYKPNGKYASLCANSTDESITSMVYRYGKPGSIEMEEIASAQRKFFVYYEVGGPSFGTNNVWFNKGDYRYEISAGVGMARGVWVNVHKGAKQLVELFSDLGDEDHYSNTLGINFSKPKSSILMAKTPL